MEKVIIFLCVIFVACSPTQRAYKKAHKSWDVLQAQIKAHPELLDTFKIIQRDTLHSVEFRDRVEYRNDPTKWDSIKVATLDSIIAHWPKEDKGAAITTVQKIVCPTVKKDTTYFLEIYNSNITIHVPIHLRVRASGGVLMVAIEAEPVRMPEAQVITKVEFKEQALPLVKNLWFWLFVSLVVLVVLVTLRR